MAAVEVTTEGAFDFADEGAGDGVAVPGLVFEVTGDGVDKEDAFGAVEVEPVAAAGEACGVCLVFFGFGICDEDDESAEWSRLRAGGDVAAATAATYWLYWLASSGEAATAAASIACSAAAALVEAPDGADIAAVSERRSL